MELELLFKTSGPILIEGPTGSGKSHLARKIFENSMQFNKPFLQLNIAAINEDLLESELFGHVRGAFTGATDRKIGFCEAVDSGILFIDEIGELSLKKQATLLTLIDEKIYYSVGSAKPKQFRGRLIFATNRNLAQMVEQQQFRADLYYRLRYHHIKLPTLNESLNFEKTFWKLFNDTKVSRKCYNIRCSERVLQNLSKYSWPGNWRELKNTIEYFFDLGKEFITVDDIPGWIKDSQSDRVRNTEIYKDALEVFEKDYLIQQLKKNSGRINTTAAKTGINKVTLISKLKKYAIDRRDYLNDNYEQVNGF